MASSVISIRLPDEVRDQLEVLAKATRRSRSFLINRAIEDFVRQNAWHAKALQQAMAEANKGEFVSEEAVDAWLDSWGTGNETDPPAVDTRPARALRSS